MEVKYEDLISDPKKTLNYVLEHCGVQYEDSLLNFSDSGIELMDESERQWKNETTGPLLTSNTQKWRTGLNNSQIAFIQTACSGPMKIYGYEMEKLNTIRFVYVHIIKVLFSLVYKLKLWFN